MTPQPHWFAALSLLAISACVTTPDTSSQTANGAECTTSFVYAQPLGDLVPGQIVPVRTCGPDGAAAIEGAALSELARSVAFSKLSPAAQSTAQRDKRSGKPRFDGYETPADAIANGDMAAFMLYTRAAARQNPRGPGSLFAAIDEIAAGRFNAARDIAQAAAPSGPTPGQGQVADLLEPWLLALSGDTQKAVWTFEDRLSPRSSRGSTLVDRALLVESVGRADLAADAYAALLPALGDELSTEERLAAGPIAFVSSNVKGRMLLWAARAMHRDGRAEKAAELYERAIDVDPDPRDAKSELALLEAGEPAVDAFSPQQGFARSLWLAAEFASAGRDVANIYSGDFAAVGSFTAEVAAVRQAALLLDRRAPELLSAASVDLLRTGAFEGGARIAQRGVKGERSAKFMLLLAEARLQQHLDEQAEEHALAAAKEAPSDAMVLRDAAGVLSQLGQSEAAADFIDEAAAKAQGAEERADVAGMRAAIARQESRIDDAIAAARAAVQADPNDDRAQVLGAMLTLSEEGWDEGVRLLRGQLSAMPDNASRMNALGYTLLDREETLEEGYRLLARALANAPGDYAIIDSYGWAHYLYGDFEEARRQITRADALSHPFPDWEVLDHLGDIYWRLERPDEAKEAWERALKGRPPLAQRNEINNKLRDGLTTEAPERRPIPEIKPEDLRPDRAA